MLAKFAADSGYGSQKSCTNTLQQCHRDSLAIRFQRDHFAKQIFLLRQP